MGIQTFWQGLLNEIPDYFTCYGKMSKTNYFCKNKIRSVLEVSTLGISQDFLESWIFQNHWVAIFFIIFLVVTFEVTLIKLWTSFQKKMVHPKKRRSCFQKSENSHQKRSVRFAAENCKDVDRLSSDHRINIFSGRTTSARTSEQNEDSFEDRNVSLDEITWTGTSESKHGSHLSESSSDRISSSLSIFHSKLRKETLSHGQHPENEWKTTQFPTKDLFLLMKNKTKNSRFSSDFNFLKIPEFTMANEDLDVTPCPPAHLLLTKDPIRLLEEDIRNQITLKLKATFKDETSNLCSRSQESLVQNQHSIRRVISAQAQDSLRGQNTIRDERFYEAQSTSQAQQVIQNPKQVNRQPDPKASYLAQPPTWKSKPFFISTEDSVPVPDMDRSQQLLKVPYNVQTKNAIKGIEPDEHLHGAQYSAQLEYLGKIKYSTQGQNNVSMNAEFVLFIVNPSLVSEDVSQLITSSGPNQCSTCTSVPLSPTVKSLGKRRKSPDSKSKLRLKVPLLKAKKTPCSRVFQIGAHHISKDRNELGSKNNNEQKELHEKKVHLISESELMSPYKKNNFKIKLVKVIPTIGKCRHFLQKQNKSSDKEKMNFSASPEQEISQTIKTIKEYDKENKGLNNISLDVLHQPKPSFMVNADELKALHSLLETNWKSKESSKDPSKLTFGLRVPKPEMPSEVTSEPRQKLVSPPQMTPNKRLEIQKGLQSAEDSYPPFSNEEDLPPGAPYRQRFSPITKAKKAPISKIFNIPWCGHHKHLPPKILKSQTIQFLICSGVLSDRFHKTLLEDATEEKKKRLAQGLPATILESFTFSKLVPLASEREGDILKSMDRMPKRSLKHITLKAKKATTFNIAGCDIKSHRRELRCYSKTKTKLSRRMADIFLTAISSPFMVSLNMKPCNRIIMTDRLQKTRFNPEPQQQEQAAHEERAGHAHFINEGIITGGTEDIKHLGGGAGTLVASHFRFKAYDMKEPNLRKSDLGLKNSATGKTLEVLTSAQELQQQTLATQSTLNSILTSSPFEKLQRTTESQKALQDSGIFSLHLNVQPRRTKQSSLTDSPLKSSRQKVDFSKILRAKQVNIYKQNKNRFLKSVTSCLIHQSSVEIPKKQVSSKTILNSKISNSVVEKASNKAHILGDQSPSIIVNAPDCDNSVNNRLKLQWDVKEKIMNMKYRKSEVDLVVTKVDEPIPSLPHFKLHKDTIDGLFSNNVKRTIRHMSHEEKDRRKPWEMKGIMDHNITLKAENPSLLSVLSGKELPLLLHSIKQESKVQEGKGKSERNLTDSYTSLSSLSQVNLHSRTEVGKDKPRILRSCLLERKSQVSSNVKRVSSAEPADRETLCNALESTCLLQKREKSGENIVDIKDIMDLICFSLKCENSPFKQILHGRKPEWDNKKQEDTKKKDKSKLGIVQNKSWNSILPSPQVEWDLRMKQGVAQLCLPPPTLQELSEATCKEPTDDNLSSIKRAKYTTKKYRMQTGEITPSERMFSMTKQSSVPQELQMNVEKKEKKTQEDKQVETEEKSSISFPPCSARKKGEEALQIKERSSFLHPKLKESPQRGKIAHEKFISDAICYSIKNTIDHILQKEESEKMESIITLKKNKSVLQNIQLDIKQEEEELQKIKDEPTVDNTTISVPSPSHVTLDSGMEKAHCIMEVIRCSLLELLQQKSSDAVRKMSRESTEGNIRMSTQKTKEHMPEKEENKIKALAKENILHPKDKDLKENKTLSQGLSLTLAEDGEMDQPSNEKKQTARESKKQEKWDHDGKKQGKTDSQGKQEGNMDGKTNEQGKMDPEGQEQEEINGECKELEKIGVDDKEQGKRDQQRKERGEMGLEDQDQEQEQEQDKPLGGEGKEQGKVYPERTEQKKVERKAEEHERVDGERKEQEKRDEEDQQQGEWDQQGERKGRADSLKTKLQMKIKDQKNQRQGSGDKTLVHLRKTCHFLSSVTSQLATRAEDEDEGGGGEGGGEEGRGETEERGRERREGGGGQRGGREGTEREKIEREKGEEREGGEREEEGGKAEKEREGEEGGEEEEGEEGEEKEGEGEERGEKEEKGEKEEDRGGREPGIIKSSVPHSVLQESLPLVSTESTASHVSSRKQHLPQEEDRVERQTESERRVNSQHEDMYSTESHIRSGEMLDLYLAGQKSQPEMHGKESLDTFHSYPTRDATETGNLEKETELIHNLKQTMSPEVLASPSLLRETFKELQVALSTSGSSKGLSVSETDDHGSPQIDLEKGEYLLQLLQKTVHLLQAFLFQSGCLDKTNTNITTNVQQKKLEKDNSSIANHEERKPQHKSSSHFTPEEENMLTNHLESKALEVNVSQIPETEKKSTQNCSFYVKQATFEEYPQRLYPRLEKKSKLPSWPQSLQIYTVQEKDKLLMHLSVKTLEIKMQAFPKVVRESYEMVKIHKTATLLPNCIHSAIKATKRKNTILLLFDEKSLREIDLNLQHKYFHYLLGSSAKSTSPKPNAFPKQIYGLTCLHEKADHCGANCFPSCDTELLKEHVTVKQQHLQEDPLFFSKGLQPSLVSAFDPGVHSRVQEDTGILSGLKSPLTPEKNKHYHVSFQETNIHKRFDRSTQENATGFGVSQSRRISDYFTDSQGTTENPTILEACTAPEIDDSDESIFLEANTSLSCESQKILYEVQNGLPSTNLFTVKDILPYLKSFNNEDSGPPHVIPHGKHTLNRTLPSSESHRKKRHRAPSKVQAPDWYTASETLHTQSVPICMTLSKERFSRATGPETSSSLSSIKIHIAKNQGKSYLYSQSKERKKPRSNLPRQKNNYRDYDSHYCHNHHKEKTARKDEVRDCKPGRPNYSYSQNKHKFSSKPPCEEIHYQEKEQHKPFVYACIITDSMEVAPKKIRWDIPANILKKNIRVPQVAKISSSWNTWKLMRNLG